MTPFTESLRYEIPTLNADSIVIDAGGYEGNWGRIICEKYGSRVHIFEPVDGFYANIMGTLAAHPKRDRMTVHHFGLAGTTRQEEFGIHGDMSGIVADGPKEKVSLLGIGDLLSNSLFEGKQLGAVKLNVEGAEFEILEAMLELGLMSRVEVLHVQFHDVVPRAAQRMEHIKNSMLITHRMIWDAPWCWIGWEPRT